MTLGFTWTLNLRTRVSKDDTPKMVLRASGIRTPKETGTKSKIDENPRISKCTYLVSDTSGNDSTFFQANSRKLTGSTYIFSMVYKKPVISD